MSGRRPIKQSVFNLIWFICRYTQTSCWLFWYLNQTPRTWIRFWDCYAIYYIVYELEYFQPKWNKIKIMHKNTWLHMVAYKLLIRVSYNYEVLQRFVMRLRDSKSIVALRTAFWCLLWFSNQLPRRALYSATAQIQVVFKSLSRALNQNGL